MKTKYFVLATASLAMCATSCSLEEENLSNVSTDVEWSTAAGYEKLINSCYFDMIRIIYGQAEDTYVMLTEGGTDIWCDARQGSNGGWSQVQTYDGSGSYTGWNEGYAGFYGCLSACNAAIKYADKVEGLTKDQINQLVAEAYFLRAHSMLNLVEVYGGKYLTLEPMTEALKELPCTSVNTWFETIISDAEFAMKNLPVTQSIRGHVIRAAAYHLYAKACMTYASYTDGLCGATAISSDEANKLYKQAQEAIDYLIDNQTTLGVKLYEDVNDVFDENNNKTNTETLFAVTHSSITAYNPRGNYFNRVWKHFGAYGRTDGIKMDGGVNSYSTTYTSKFDGKVYSVPKYAANNCYIQGTKYLFDSYGPLDKRYKAFFKDTWYVNTPTVDNGSTPTPVYRWTEGDATRFGLDASRAGNAAFDIPINDTMVFISKEPLTLADRNSRRYATYNIDDNHADLNNPGKFFPSLKKMDCPSLYGGTNPGKCYSSADCIIYRLGESYLMSAELAWRLGDNDKAAKRINVIRERACSGLDTKAMDVSASDINQDFILDEYGREMCGEWSRWFLLKRFRAFESRLAKCNPQAAAHFNKDVNYLRQIPLAELNKIDNKDEYQNPGY